MQAQNSSHHYNEHHSDLPNLSDPLESLDWGFEEFSEDQILNYLRSNPIGQLLELIARLPEVRDEKIFRARRDIESHDPELDSRFDAAMDRVLEELFMEG